MTEQEKDAQAAIDVARREVAREVTKRLETAKGAVELINLATALERVR